jgi:hypothetical protein
MLCLGCGAQMRLVQVVKDTTMLVTGYEHHTWQCSGCSTVERRMTFTSESTPPPMVAVELAQTAPVEPAQMVPAEPNQTVQVEPSHPTPVETTVPVEATQTTTAEPAIQGHQPPRFKQAARAKTLDKVQKRETGASEAERRAEFNRFWDNLLSVPSSSTSSEALSRITPDELVSAHKEPAASPAPTTHRPRRAAG